MVRGGTFEAYVEDSWMVACKTLQVIGPEGNADKTKAAPTSHLNSKGRLFDQPELNAALGAPWSQKVLGNLITGVQSSNYTTMDHPP